MLICFQCKVKDFVPVNWQQFAHGMFHRFIGRETAIKVGDAQIEFVTEFTASFVTTSILSSFLENPLAMIKKNDQSMNPLVSLVAKKRTLQFR